MVELGQDMDKQLDREKPDPEKENMLRTAGKLSVTCGDTGVRINSLSELLNKPYPEEIINDPKIFPSYEELEGNTEG